MGIGKGRGEEKVAKGIGGGGMRRTMIPGRRKRRSGEGEEEGEEDTDEDGEKEGVRRSVLE